MRRLVAVLLCATMVSACGGDTPGTPISTDITGTYTLKTMNGSPLPFVIQSGTTTVTRLSDTLIVSSNGTWSQTIAYRETVNGQTTNTTGTRGGPWERREDSKVYLNSSDGPSGNYGGTYSANTLTLGNSGYVFVYTK